MTFPLLRTMGREEVATFVSANVDARRLVIHCDVGASRSVSVAMALAKCFIGEDWRPRWLVGHDLRERPAPNPIVYTAIVAAFNRAWGNARNRPLEARL